MDRITALWTTALDPAGVGSIDDASFATDQSYTTLTVDVPYHGVSGDVVEATEIGRDLHTDIFATTGSNLHKFCYQCLGYATHPSTGTLNRWPPARHPIWPWLRATKISSIKGMKEFRREQSPLGQVRGTPLGMQVYSLYRLTILFEGLPYQCLENSEINGSEKNRFVTEIVQTRAEILSRPGGQFKFVAGTNPGNQSPQVAFPQPIGYTHQTYEIHATWHQVPEPQFSMASIPPVSLRLLEE